MNKVFWFLMSFCLILPTHRVSMASEAAELSKANEVLELSALKARKIASDKGFEKFKTSVFKEPFKGGVYIVNGDTPISTEEELRTFYEKEVQKGEYTDKFGLDVGTEIVFVKDMKSKSHHMKKDNSDNRKLIVDAPGGIVAIWSKFNKRQISYCVSKSFGKRYNKVVKDMEKASDAWMKVSDVKLIHKSSSDDNCTPSTIDVKFDVRPVNVSGEYLARAFFPRFNRVNRSLLIDESSFKLDPSGNLELAGILRHELGHVLGFRHEHTRPESGQCYEDSEWKPLGDYDAFSVMHYPQCNGLGDWSLTLTQKDKDGAAKLYGSSVY